MTTLAPAIITDADRTLLAFPGDVAITLVHPRGLYAGIARVALGGVAVAVAGRGGAPYAVTPDGIAYDAFRLIAVRADGDDVVVELDAIGRRAPLMQDTDLFRFPLLAPGGGEVHDRLDVRFAPRSQRVGGEAYHGFAVAYEFRSDERRIHWLLETLAMAPGGSLRDAVVLHQHMTTGHGRLEERVGVDTRYCTAEAYDRSCIEAPNRGAGSPLFDLVQGAGVAVASWYERPDSLKSIVQSLPGEDFITCAELHYHALDRRFATQPRVVLAAAIAGDEGREARVDRWTAWHDHTTAAWCDALGLAPTRSVPTLAFDGTGAGGIDPGCTWPGLLVAWEARLDWVRDQGIGAIVLHTPEWLSAANQRTVVLGGNNCSPFRLRLSEHLGGEAGLKRFCDAAHARGIKVFGWIAGHFAGEAPVWREHPEWAVRHLSGEFWDGHYRTIQAISFVDGGRRWLLDDLARVRAATGMDGVWFDSLHNMAAQAINHQSPGREPNAPGVLRFLGEIGALGYEIMVETMSQLGVSSWGNLSPTALRGQEELLYRTGLRTYLHEWNQRPEEFSRDFYFRSLAAGGPLNVWVPEFLGRQAPFPLPLPEWYAPLSRAYRRVCARMHRRRLLPQGRGALWSDADGRPAAFFAFADGPSPVAAPAVDLIAGEPAVGVRAGRVYAYGDA